MTLPFSIPAEPHRFGVAADVLECVADLIDAAGNSERQGELLESHTAQWHACHVDLLVGMVLTDLAKHGVPPQRCRAVANKWRRHGDAPCN